MPQRAITPDDVLSMEAYVPVRKARRAAVNEVKRNRRVEVGPFVSFYFENFDTMLHQVHEMLYAERWEAKWCSPDPNRIRSGQMPMGAPRPFISCASRSMTLR